MQLVIIHYHLNRGGVTRVIESHLRGLATLELAKHPSSVMVLYGGRCEGWNDALAEELPFPVTLVSLKSLDYASEIGMLETGVSEIETDDRPQADLVLAVQQAFINASIDRRSAIVHIHNHSLGKNRQLPTLVGQLARDGWRLLLQPHDFAEELRPSNYRYLVSDSDSVADVQAHLYPQADHLRYAVLNRRDYRVLEKAGFQHVELLPNPAGHPLEAVPRNAGRDRLARFGVPADRPYVIYPVRGIRRKNLGELLLWSAVFPTATFAVTLAPLNPDERNSYQYWVGLADELGLSVLFDVGGAGGVTLAENYAAADAIITTSVAEGFGLVFLEAYQFGLPLYGRDLPGITDDFRDAGMTFPGLTSQIQIPTTAVDWGTVTQQREDLFHALCADYELPETGMGVVDRREHDETVFLPPTELDFGRLGRDFQQTFLRRVVGSTELRASLGNQNDGMRAFARWLESGKHEQPVQDNRRVIQEKYSVQVIGERYYQICRGLLDSEVGHVRFETQFGERVLSQFVKLDWLFPIRIEK